LGTTPLLLPNPPSGWSRRDVYPSGF
jgi:hypothetical protein